MNTHHQQARRTVLMEQAMKRFFGMFDEGMTDEEIVQSHANQGVAVPEQFVGSVRINWELLEKAKLELKMAETKYKNLSRKIVNNADGIDSIDLGEKQLASGLKN